MVSHGAEASLKQQADKEHAEFEKDWAAWATGKKQIGNWGSR